jgi:hypothetical protein
VERRWKGPGRSFADIRSAVAELEAAARSLNAARDAALKANDLQAIAAINRGLMQAERAFLDPAGIPDRPWYRHQVYAPKHTYAPELLPGVAEAIDRGADDSVVLREAQRLSAAIRRAAATLSSAGRVRPG